MWRSLAALAALSLSVAGCDRRMEPYVEEEPRTPDLSRIFPAGAEQSARQGSAAIEPPPPPGVAPASGDPIRGTVQVAPGLEGRVRPDAVLFLIARPGSAGPPLAVKRIASPRFPFDFELGPEDRMIQTMPFAGPLQLSARLDADGNATTRTPGDLQGSSDDAVEPGASGVELVLDQVL